MQSRPDSMLLPYFDLPDDITIRDDGQAIYFSANNDKDETLATKLAKARWGQSATISGNNMMKTPEAEHQFGQDQSQDLNGLGR